MNNRWTYPKNNHTKTEGRIKIFMVSEWGKRWENFAGTTPTSPESLLAQHALCTRPGKDLGGKKMQPGVTSYSHSGCSVKKVRENGKSLGRFWGSSCQASKTFESCILGRFNQQKKHETQNSQGERFHQLAAATHSSVRAWGELFGPRWTRNFVPEG